MVPPRYPALITAALAVLAVFVIAGTHPRRAGAQDAPAVTCQELRDQDYAVVLTGADVGGDDSGLCVVERPEEDTFIAFLPNVATADDFRAAKQRYGGALIDTGYDVCRISVWRPLNRGDAEPPALTAADQLDGPAVCAPRVVARDAAAARWIAPVQDALGPIVDRTIADFGFTPHRPLTVDLYTDPDALAAAAQAGSTPSADPSGADRAARTASAGRSYTIFTPTRGVFILLNLSQNPSPDDLRQRLAHEYTHFMQTAAGGTLNAYPLWFIEGEAEFQMERIAGTSWDHQTDAARRDASGSAPHLGQLVTRDGWTHAENAAGSDAVYGRAYSAVAYIAQRWGFDATVRLLTGASDADPSRFDRTLQDITGLGLDGLDQALSAWLRTFPARATFYNDSPLGQRLYFAGGRTLDLPACTGCTFLKAAAACTPEGRPTVSIELPAGDYAVLRVVPDDRVHFPDSTLRLHLDPAGVTSQCLALRAGAQT